MKLLDSIMRKRSAVATLATDAPANNTEADMASTVPAPAASVTPEPIVPPVAAVAPAAPIPIAPPTPAAATFAELNAEFGDDPAFIVEAQAKAMAMTDAHRAYAAKLRQQNSDMKKVSGIAPGEKPIAGVMPKTRASGKDSTDPYIAECERVMAEKDCDFPAATVIVNKNSPDLRAAYVGRKTA